MKAKGKGKGKAKAKPKSAMKAKATGAPRKAKGEVSFNPLVDVQWPEGEERDPQDLLPMGLGSDDVYRWGD
jgi:hypothetical protein